MAVNPIKVWNGTAWEYTGPVVAAPPVKYQATAPTSPATGDVWVESDYDVASVDPSKLLTGGVYTNESTRSAAIPTPTTGMVTYVGDTGTESPSSTIPQLEAYTGAAWQNLGGLTLIANVSLTSATSVTLSNVFSSTYDNYKIMIRARAASGQTGIFYNSVTGGTVANGAGTYVYSSYYTSGNATTGTNFQSTASDTAVIAQITDQTDGSDNWSMDVYSPALARRTSGNFTGAYGSGLASTFGGFLHAVSTSYDGFRLLSQTGTALTGTVSVYGYRKS
jgi:hypothetical protein